MTDGPLSSESERALPRTRTGNDRLSAAIAIRFISIPPLPSLCPGEGQWVYYPTPVSGCSDASYYVGHTDDVETRVSDHNAGGLSAYTRKRRPVKLVFAEEFQTREEALARERQLQGWSRAKKEALISGNWERVRLLSRSAAEIKRAAEEARAAHDTAMN